MELLEVMRKLRKKQILSSGVARSNEEVTQEADIK